MKTKIIYISGGEAFPPAEVRGALDTIRGMLKLDADTILFGVPVDNADIRMGVVSEAPVFSGATDNTPEYVAAESAPIAETALILKTDTAAQKPAEISEISEKPAPTRKPRKTKAAAIETSAAEPVKSKPVAPILSVIGGVMAEPVPVEVSKPETVVTESVTVLELDADDSPDGTITTLYQFTDTDDDADNEIKSIEDIFEGLSPIAEDRPVDLNKYDGDDTETESESPQRPASPSAKATGDRMGDMSIDLESDAEIDATLSKLATEFARAQDNHDIEGGPAPHSPEGAKGGRIGKLKNILPFKKKDRAESSLMSDLFGWAGIAANDDTSDFEMPEFFRVRN
ncbi:MAG: hypothetical protein FWC51_02960 [Proteobacteria bacterium]|nr:hypothetical protein [Pseudomonadota bacterium]